MPQSLHFNRAPGVQSRTGGFTLIEVMIVVAILAIIAAIALPSYFDSIRKARRSDAINALAKAQQAQERYRANSADYGPLFNVGAPAFAIAASGAASGVETFDGADGFYTIDITANAATNYTLLAFAKAGSSQAKDMGCQCLQLTSTGGNITYGAGGPTSGTFNGTLANCGTIAVGPAANRCWRR